MINWGLVKEGISAVIGTFGFSLLFGLKKYKLLWSTVGGMVVWGVYAIMCATVSESLFLCNFIPAIIGTLYSQILARVIKAPATMFIFPSLVVLVPGGMLYYSMSSIIRGDIQGGFSRAMDTVEVSFALALGIVVIMAMVKIIYHIKRTWSKQ